MTRPVTTLFLIISLDGKISTGDTNELDVDKDFTDIVGLREGLFQYYDLEKQTDRVSFNTGKVLAKIGVNSRDLSSVKKSDVDFVIVDNEPHLDRNGTEYFAKRTNIFYLITNNKNHSAFELQKQYDNIKILYYEGEVDFIDVFRRFKEEFGIERVTIQTGGTLNATLLRLKLIDRVSIVIAPCLIGGKDTPSLVSGESLHKESDLKHIKALKMTKCEQLKENYLLVEYDVVNETKLAE